MQNSLVYPISTRDEAHFPFIGSIAIPCSTEYSTSGLTSLRKLQRFSETPASSLYEYSFQHSSLKKVPCTTYRLKMRAEYLSLTEELTSFPQAPHVAFSLSNRALRGTLCFLSQVECTARGLTQRKARFPCSGLNLGSCFMSQDEGMSETPVETLEKAVGLRLIWKGGIISL